MLEIQALTYNDLAPVVPIAGLLPEEGGTIGRGPHNAIVLPDPMRLVSRQHLQVVPEGKGLYRLVNISGANLVYINSEELLPGLACMAKAGDKVYVGGYVLLLAERKPGATPLATEPLAAAVGATSAAALSASPPSAAEPVPETDDFLSALFAEPGAAKNPQSYASEPPPHARDTLTADPLELLMQPMASRHQDPMQSLAREGVDLRSLAGKGDALINAHDGTDRSDELLREPGDGRIDSLLGSNSVDPLAFFGAGAGAGQGDALGGMNWPASDSGGYPPAVAASSSNHGSDLAGLFQTPELTQTGAEQRQPAVATHALPDDFDAFLSPLTPEAEPAAPAVYGHVPASAGDPSLVDASWMPEQGLGRRPAEGVDPLGAGLLSVDALLGPSSEDALAALLSEAPEPPDALEAPVGPEAAAIEPEPAFSVPVEPPAAAAPRSVQRALPAEVEAAGSSPAAVPSIAAIGGGASGAVNNQAAAVPAPAAAAPRPEAATAASHLEAAAPASGVEDPLYQALLKGLGLNAIPDRSQLDANFMYLIGQLLRCTSQGTVDLMAGRAVVKREVKANVTLIAPERNNPLKFSPDGEVALMYLLGRTYPGFMQPAEAMNSAYLDLRAHQIGLVSGMRSALGHVLDRFDPANIDNDSIEAGLLSGLGYGRKAKLWDAYGRYYQATRDEAEDRFQEFFGAAFLKAYEEATASLKLSEAPQKNEGGLG